MAEIKLDCKCMDIDSLNNLRLALLTSRDTYDDIAKRLLGNAEAQLGMEIYKNSSEAENVRNQATKFERLLLELDKIPPCNTL